MPPPRFDYFNGVTLSRIEKDFWENLRPDALGEEEEMFRFSLRIMVSLGSCLGKSEISLWGRMVL